MTSIPLLVGLLVLAYLGSFLVGGRTVRGVGLPSGLEYVALGFVLGPRVLDVIAADTLQAFEPVVQVALGWLAFGIGLDFGFARGKRVPPASLALGLFGALLTGCSVAAATWAVLRYLHAGGSTSEQILLAGGIGAACSETTRHAVRWVVERYDARGPLSDRLNEAAHADDLLPWSPSRSSSPSSRRTPSPRRSRCATGRSPPSASAWSSGPAALSSSGASCGSRTRGASSSASTSSPSARRRASRCPR